jgi:hypothetical protein
MATVVAACAALGASAHDGHRRSHDHERTLRGGSCLSAGGDRYRIVDAVSLRRSAERRLDRLPLRRERLGYQDTLIVVERIEEPLEPTIYSMEQRIAQEEARKAAIEAEEAAAEAARADEAATAE